MYLYCHLLNAFAMRTFCQFRSRRCLVTVECDCFQVEDVVGYNTLGHCFFLEDGNERDNVLIHNLGLVTKPGSLLPSDRDAAMCTGLSVAAQRFQYIPDADNECMYIVSVCPSFVLQALSIISRIKSCLT